MKFLKFLAALFLTTFFVQTLCANEKLFSEANRLYEQAKYKEAAEIYTQILRERPRSFEVHFNLGNTYLKQNQLGRAIAEYRLAQQISPRDSALAANLKYAREQTQQTGGKSPAAAFLDRLRTEEWMLLMTAGVWLTFLTLMLQQIFPAWRKATSGYPIILGLITACLTAAAIVSYHRQHKTMIGVVITREANVRRGPLDESQSAFIVSEGKELTVTDIKNDWCQIIDGPHRVGWIPSRHLTLIKPL